MWIRLTKPWLAAWTLTVLAAWPALAQYPEDEGPLTGLTDPMVSDVQLWAPADLSDYGGGIRPPKGWLFAYDFLHWSITSPDKTTIGAPSTEGRQVFYGPTLIEMRVQNNNLDTGFLGADFTDGTRFELGYMGEHDGLIFGLYDLHSQVQKDAFSGADMVWIDPEFGPDGRRLLQGYYLFQQFDPDADPPEGPVYPPDVPPEDAIVVETPDGDFYSAVIRNLPVTFDDVTVENRVKTWSVELMAAHRCHAHPCLGYFDIYAGARYLQFDETFSVVALNTIQDVDGNPLLASQLYGKSLSNSEWSTEAQNHIIGPQVGARWFFIRGPWTFSAEGRFLAGFNQQNIRQQGTLASELPLPVDDSAIVADEGQPLVMRPSSFSHAYHDSEWSPVAELRLQLKYQFTRSVFGRVGWTGIWMDGIARSSNMILYQVPDMGILTDNNTQDVFINGVTAGLTVNY